MNRPDAGETGSWDDTAAGNKWPRSKLDRFVTDDVQ